MLVNKFNYVSLSRTTEKGKRLYNTPDGGRLVSVTTLLEATKSEESKQTLNEWRRRVGDQEANRIAKEASGRGTSMHKHIENWLNGREPNLGTNLVHQQAAKMATVIIETALKPNLTEAWGNEIGMYYPELYAGTCDLAGIWMGEPAILDFKQSNRPKKREWIEDYFIQVLFYGTAHNKMFGTNINTGVILVCTQACEYQEFVIKGKEWTKYEGLMWDRLEQYYKNHYLV